MASETADRDLKRTRSNGSLHHGYNRAVLGDQPIKEAMFKFFCRLCKFILRNPRQTHCGHRMCLLCLEEHSGQIDPSCPACEEEGEENTLSVAESFEDKGIMRDLAKLDCVCINDYCMWSGKFPQYMVHERICEFADTKSVSDSESESGDLSSDSEVEVLYPPQSGISSDGFSFDFCINGFKEKLNRAKQGGLSRVIFSQPHVTGNPGYTVAACVYLNGDGMAKGRYMSLFVAILKGEFDDKLKWPFNRFVTMELVNQDQRRSIRYRFAPDFTSSSFKRPTQERNPPSGCPQFCPIGKLNDARQGFVINDKLMIRIVVGEEDICTFPEG